MNAPFSWIKEYTDLEDISVKELCDALTLSGSKVERTTCEADEIKGVCHTVLGEREYLNDVQVETEGEVTTFIYGGDAVLYESDENHLDVIALENGYASITPLQKDMTAYKAGDMLADWRIGK